MRKEQAFPESVHLLSVGPFASAVAGWLKIFRNDVIETSVTDEQGVQPEIARITVVAAWRPVSRLCELLDTLSFEWPRPFVPLIVESSILRLGPIVMPGRGACWHCWQQRARQHSEWAFAQSALLQHYASSPQAGPQGFLEPFAMMAAARIAQVIEDLDSQSAVPGFIWQVDMLSRVIKTAVTVGIHDCPRCGLHRPMAELSFAAMQRDLAYLWTQARMEKL
jgi:bacteriocin biosynthesis cyclodehydratase domain-containing protein